MKGKSRRSRSSNRERLPRNGRIRVAEASDEDFVRARDVVDPEFARKVAAEDPSRLTALEKSGIAPRAGERLPAIRPPDNLGKVIRVRRRSIDPEGYLKKDLDAEEMFGEPVPASDQDNEGEEASEGGLRKLHTRRKRRPNRRAKHP